MGTIQLEGVRNIRDFGGTTVRGGSIKPARLIRSSSLAGATELDVKALRDLHHLEQIIDLRTTLEVASAPDVSMEGVAYASVPLIHEEALGITHGRDETQDLMDMMNMGDMVGLYEGLVSAPRIAQWRSVFDILLTPREGAVLWHCSEGKDRCGLVSAMVLYALGASMEDIVADYLKTNETAVDRAAEMSQMVLKKTGNAAIAEKVKDMFLVKQEYFDAAVAAITKEYGSLDAFLEEVCGVDDEKRRTLRAMYCVEG